MTRLDIMDFIFNVARAFYKAGIYIGSLWGTALIALSIVIVGFAAQLSFAKQNKVSPAPPPLAPAARK